MLQSSIINSVETDSLEIVMNCGNVISFTRSDWIKYASHNYFKEIAEFVSDGYLLNTRVYLYSVNTGYNGIEIGDRILQAFATIGELLYAVYTIYENED